MGLKPYGIKTWEREDGDMDGLVCVCVLPSRLGMKTWGNTIQSTCRKKRVVLRFIETWRI